MSKQNIVIAGVEYSGVEKVSFTTAEGGKAAFVETSDATAAAANIDKGKIAYVNGSKITGTSEKVSTADATATANKMLNGATAYVNGEKITGNFQTTFVALDSENNVSIPASVMNLDDSAFMYIYGDLGNATAEHVEQGYTFTTNDGVAMVGTLVPLDTSDATAVAREIAMDKTVYVDGEKIVGTGLNYFNKQVTAWENTFKRETSSGLGTNTVTCKGISVMPDIPITGKSYVFLCGWITFVDSNGNTKQHRFGGGFRISDVSIASKGSWDYGFLGFIENDDSYSIAYGGTNTNLTSQNLSTFQSADIHTYYRIF